MPFSLTLLAGLLICRYKKSCYFLAPAEAPSPSARSLRGKFFLQFESGSKFWPGAVFLVFPFRFYFIA